MGLVAQQYSKIKHEIKTIYGNNHEKTIKEIEKEISYLKGKLVNSNQLSSSFGNKTATCFLQEDAFPWKPTDESSKNKEFAINTTPDCLTLNKPSRITLNSTTCDEGDNLLKTNLDEQVSKYKNDY